MPGRRPAGWSAELRLLGRGLGGAAILFAAIVRPPLGRFDRLRLRRSHGIAQLLTNTVTRPADGNGLGEPAGEETQAIDEQLGRQQFVEVVLRRIVFLQPLFPIVADVELLAELGGRLGLGRRARRPLARFA